MWRSLLWILSSEKKSATDDVKVATDDVKVEKAATVTLPRTGEVTAARGATAARKTLEVHSAPQRAFVPFCHHCGVRGHIMPRCFKLLREKHHIEANIWYEVS